MREKCCKNCLYFIDESKPNPYPSANWDIKYACHLHGSDAWINDPERQFCGGENWISIKVKEREQKLEQLGI